MGSAPLPLPPLASLFAGTFNLNGSPLLPPDADLWIRRCGADSADVAFLSLQECPTAAAGSADPALSPPARSGTVGDRPRGAGAGDDGCFDGDGEAECADRTLRSIMGALSPDHNVVADLSMGEPPTGGKVETSVPGRREEWYGYARLIVLARGDLADTMRAAAVPILCPAGNKPSSLPGRPPYAPGSCPDKGAVCLAVPGRGWDVLFVSAHLCGTNRYGVPEDEFDSERIRQLGSIADSCRAALGREAFGRARVVAAGDLNFRCEVHRAPEDKVRGGRDFRSVEATLSSGDDGEVRRLFRGHDRLVRFLGRGASGGGGAGASSTILGDVEDMFWRRWCSAGGESAENGRDGGRRTLGCGGRMVLPTFTFPVGRAHPRPYSDKRTPSWTDRILVSRALLGRPGCEVVSLGGDFDVVMSDHVPVHCLIRFG